MSRLAIILPPAVATNLAMCTRNFSRSCPCVARWLQARSPGVQGAGMEDTPWSDDDLDRTAKAAQKRRRRSVQTPNVQESESPWSHDLTAGEDDPWLMDGDDPWLGMDSVAEHPSSTSTGSAQAAARTTNTVSLTPSSLALVAHTTPGGQLSAYATKGMDPCKVKERLTTAGRQCRCRDGHPCNNNVPLNILQRTCSIFWQLKDEERAHLIRCMHMEAAGLLDVAGQEMIDSLTSARPPSVKCSLCGIPVCFNVFCALLGTSGPTVRKYVRGELDMRKTTADMRAAPRAQLQSRHCDWWFYELYQSAAEPLPEESVDADALLASMEGVGDPWLQPDLATNCSQDCAIADRPTVESMVRLTLAASASVIGLPKRFLPHGKVHDLYWVFLAAWDLVHQPHTCSGVQESECDQPLPTVPTPPSWPTFWRRWTQVWSHHLSFRKASQHSQCQTCFELQQELHARKNPLDRRVLAARTLRQHYHHQYLDRCIYWSLRLASQRDWDVLCIIIDSMDKSKFAWPRWQFDRVPKRLETLNRPRMVLTAAIAHGYCARLHFADETVSHGSSAFCEILRWSQLPLCHACSVTLGDSETSGLSLGSFKHRGLGVSVWHAVARLRVQTIEHVAAICQRTGRPFPRHLVVQSDNTVAQAKNTYATLFLAYLVAKHKFTTCNLLFLMVGHNHEDVDQLFGVICGLIQRKRCYEVPEELMAFVRSNLESKFRDKGEELRVERLTTVRDFAEWLSPLEVTLSNAFANRDGIESPHAFSFKLRRDLLPAERKWMQGQPQQRRRCPGVPESEEDVFCCVKTYMRDLELQQAPVLVIPADRPGRVATPGPVNVVPLHEMKAKTIEQLLLLAQECEMELDLPRAAQALKDLVRKRVYILPDDTWLTTVCQPTRVVEVPGGNPFFQHLPETSWQLVARLG